MPFMGACKMEVTDQKESQLRQETRPESFTVFICRGGSRASEKQALEHAE